MQGLQNVNLISSSHTCQLFHSHANRVTEVFRVLRVRVQIRSTNRVPSTASLPCHN